MPCAVLDTRCEHRAGHPTRKDTPMQPEYKIDQHDRVWRIEEDHADMLDEHGDPDMDAEPMMVAGVAHAYGPLRELPKCYTDRQGRLWKRTDSGRYRFDPESLGSFSYPELASRCGPLSPMTPEEYGQVRESEMDQLIKLTREMAVKGELLNEKDKT